MDEPGQSLLNDIPYRRQDKCYDKDTMTGQYTSFTAKKSNAARIVRTTRSRNSVFLLLITLPASREERIIAPFQANFRSRSVTGQNNGVIGQRHELCFDALYKLMRIAAVKIRSAD